MGLLDEAFAEKVMAQPTYVCNKITTLAHVSSTMCMHEVLQGSVKGFAMGVLIWVI